MAGLQSRVTCAAQSIAAVHEQQAAAGEVERNAAIILAKMIENGEREVRDRLGEHLARLWRYAIVLARRRDVAEDLVQATCVRALERSHQFQPGSRLDSWLLAILHSIWLNETRARRVRAAEDIADHEADAGRNGSESVEMTVHARQVLRQVGELPEGQRAAILLVYVEGFAYREAAAILGIPVGTVMSRLASARSILADHFSTDAIDAPSKART